MILACLLLAAQAAGSPPPPAAGGPPPVAAPAPSLTLVLPSEADQEDSGWVGEAVAELLPVELLRLGVAVVDRSDRLRAYEALEIPPVRLSRATAIRIAEALGANRVLVPAHAFQDDRLSLSVRILDVERGTLGAPLFVGGSRDGLVRCLRTLAWDLALSGSTPPAVGRDAFYAEPEPPAAAVESLGRALSAADGQGRRKQLEHALALAPGLDAARLALGRAFVQTRDFEAAIAILSRVPATSPLHRRARFLHGVGLHELGQYRAAASLYAELARAEPSPAVLNNLALALLRDRLGAPAVGPAREPPGQDRPSELLRRAVDLEPASADLGVNLGLALLAEGEGEAAAFWLRTALRHDTSDASARLLLSWALRAAGHPAEAEEQRRVLAGLAPSLTGLTTPDLTRRLERLQPSERLLVLDQEARSDAEVAATLVGRGERFLDAGNPGPAVRELTRAAYLDPHGARVHLLLSRAHRRLGEREKALAEVRMSLWCRDDVAVRLELASLLAEMGLAAEAGQEARRVLEKDPGNEAARRLLPGR